MHDFNNPVKTLTSWWARPGQLSKDPSPALPHSISPRINPRWCKTGPEIMWSRTELVVRNAYSKSNCKNLAKDQRCRWLPPLVAHPPPERYQAYIMKRTRVSIIHLEYTSLELQFCKSGALRFIKLFVHLSIFSSTNNISARVSS